MGFALSFVVLSVALSQPDLEQSIEAFLSDDTITEGAAVPFSVDGKTDQVRAIIRAKLNDELSGFEYLQLQAIAFAIGDSDLETDVLRKAVASLTKRRLEPLSESIIVERFSIRATGKDADLLQRVLESGNLQLPRTAKGIEILLNDLRLNIDATDTPGGESSKKGNESKDVERIESQAVRHNAELSRFPTWALVVIAVAMLGILFLLVRAVLRRRAS
jgi:hypothetical protein